MMIFIVAIMMMAWTYIEVHAMDTEPAVCAENTLKGEAFTLSDADTQEIKDFVKTVWFKMPPGTNEIEPVTRYLTDSFNEPLTEAYEKFNKLTDETEMVGLAEVIFCWWGAQDPDPNGTFNEISIISASENEAVVKVEFLNYTNPETHTLHLKKVNGKWLLDNFDDLKDCICGILSL